MSERLSAQLADQGRPYALGQDGILKKRVEAAETQEESFELRLRSAVLAYTSTYGLLTCAERTGLLDTPPDVVVLARRVVVRHGGRRLCRWAVGVGRLETHNGRTFVQLLLRANSKD